MLPQNNKEKDMITTEFLLKTIALLVIGVISVIEAILIYDNLIMAGNRNDLISGKFYLCLVAVIFLGLVVDIIII